MIGTIINAAAIVVGGTIGILFKKRLSEKTIEIAFQGLGLITLGIGISLFIKSHSLVVVVLSILAGSISGVLLNLNQRIENAFAKLKKRFTAVGENFGDGLITAFLLFCMGALAILGPIEEGVGKGSQLLFTKATIDGFAAIALGSALGLGVLFSSIPLFIYQGSITVLAIYLGNFFDMAIIDDLSATGGVLLMGIGLNMIKVTKIEISNMLPSILFAIVFSYIYIHIM
ncbi:MAG TPA: DUF554 domain-containing protein [Marinilabiliaceae bacterium]|nr:DUF554 domain-containing protein [Marinilabiliaceae bacterium]